MEVEKARMEAALNALKQEGEAEAALAAARVLEAAVLDQAESVKPPDIPATIAAAVSRTQEYVDTHFHNNTNMEGESKHSREQKCDLDNTHTTGPDISAAAARGYPPSSPPVWQPKLPPPHWSNYVGAAKPQRQADVSDLAALLSRRDLLTAGLTVFDNKPETYLAWRSTFHNATEDLNLKCSEELDLLTKWLSGESLQHALRIRAVHVNNPETGLQRLWQRLDRIYGSSEVIEASLFKRLESFPRVTPRDNHLLQELADLLLELEAAKNEGYLPGLSFLDTPRGINPIVEKLPHTLQESWIKQGSKYKKEHRVHYPPFSYFVQFVNSNAEMKTDPSFILQNYSTGHMRIERPLVRQSHFRAPLTANKTQVGTPSNKSNTHSLDPDKRCPVHMKPHSLAKCRGFRMKTLDERKSLLKGLSICYKCLSSTEHRAKDCKADIRCLECKSDTHISAMHAGPPPWRSGSFDSTPEAHGGEPDIPSSTVTTSNCTEVCGQGQQGRSCSKICMVKVYHSTAPQMKTKMYAILDDQSNVSLARSPFFDMFNVHGEAFPYTMKTCSGTTNKTGRRAHGFVIEGVDGKVSIPLPTLTECNQIPDNRSEIPTPEAAAAHHHLAHIAAQIPPLDPEADILLLLGRDVIQAHKVRRQANGPNEAPYAQKLDLGWVIVGDVCLSGAHRPTLNSYKTNILDNGRPSFLSPCGNRIYTKVKITEECPLFESTQVKDELGKHIFQQTTDDDKMALSAEDKTFLNIMHKEFAKDDANNWVAPLPFRHPRRRLPNNREQALNCLMSLRKTLKRKTEMKDHYMEFMKRIFDKGHAERAPPLKPHQECWYLPHFGVYHPQKPAKIRIVFDSSAQFENVSLNQVLCKGPDLNNSLVGVLLRFRGDPHAVMADVEQMFHNFTVREDHRDYLRFLWFRDHDLDGEVDEFHMTVHVFGNCPSPSVAIYGLKKTAVEGEKEYGSDVREFIERHFYVDDGLKSFPSETQAIDVLHRTQRMLAQSNIRLHKISSNSPVVVSAFPSEDLATGPQELQRGQHAPLMQRSLGLGWDLSTDQLSFQVEINDRPFTKRGVLSVINSLYDPLGFAVPVSIEGRSILREISMDISEWDAPLPREKQDKWQQWKDSLKHLQQLKISRMYTSISLSESQRKEMHVFCDASTKAVGAVAYLKLTAGNGLSEVGFLLGKARLAPKPDITIPRLELCAAVLAVEVAEMVQQELHTTIDEVNFYTDSKVVLGYIFNEKRRFYVYVHNRVERIRRSTQTHQWHYVPTQLNPADHATRALPAEHLSHSTWLSGPAFLTDSGQRQIQKEPFDLVCPENDTELRPDIVSCATFLSKKELGTTRFERFSNWSRLLKTIARLLHIAESFKGETESTCRGWHKCNNYATEEQLQQAKVTIIRAVQKEVYADDIKRMEQSESIRTQSPLSKLSPYIDADAVLRVGGRLARAQLSTDETHPMLIPSKHHITQLMIRHFHAQVCHQGRHFTEGAIRAAGFWIVGGKRAVSSVIFNCVICRRLRGKQQEQIMSDLPEDRMCTDPPFTCVGLDVFGPWPVTVRKTRGGQAEAKRWAVIFTCMSTRAIHIEVIEAMDTSSFINALRRFVAMRGAVKLLRSDCGTNFVSACRELQIDKKGCHNDKINKYLGDRSCEWQFNPPHASHMAGSWERMIGVSRRILDVMLLQHGNAKLTHEVLVTFMSEVTAIVNSRPLTTVSADSEHPEILTPAMLLTQKVGAPPVPPGQFHDQDLFRAQWRRVQYLANIFWGRWRREYLSGLQGRRKWRASKPNLQIGDVVLLKEGQENRIDWPLGLVTKTFPSQDGRVRKIEVKIIRSGECRVYLRPISEVVLLVPKS
ncbi:uncharacterized protein LOC113029762 [Astatotilapia calliptera]|uniref:uncharacterized protein LOC113029762 n=1 Tax=Astatotilapia calliptera TaxID=8154 RepID=UPI000E40F54A|nr:uncharacterized protein LOC113029762 [Astatotilapia calliptera]